MSKQKDALYSMVMQYDGHPSAEELFLLCKENNIKMSIATIYRNLNVLVSEGAIAKISIPGHPDRYDSKTEAHVHAVCDRCDAIEDLNVPGLDEFLRMRTNLDIHSYDLTVHYTCPKCRKKEALNIY